MTTRIFSIFSYYRSNKSTQIETVAIQNGRSETVAKQNGRNKIVAMQNGRNRHKLLPCKMAGANRQRVQTAVGKVFEDPKTGD